MDKKKISDGPIIPWAITLVLCLAIATLIRLVALAKGVDNGTANLVFVIVMGCCVVLYLIIWTILGESLIPWMMKRFQNRQIASPNRLPVFQLTPRLLNRLFRVLPRSKQRRNKNCSPGERKS